jgi:hypothetical protein
MEEQGLSRLGSTKESEINFPVITNYCITKISQIRGFGVLGFWGFGGVFIKIAFENSNSNIKLSCLINRTISSGNSNSCMNIRSPKKHIKKLSVICPMKKDK